MPLQSSGQISMNNIRVELGISTKSPFELNKAEDGVVAEGYPAINPCSPNRPNSTNPASISEWYGYCHTCTCTPTATPTTSPTPSCVNNCLQTVNINVSTAGNIYYFDCYNTLRYVTVSTGISSYGSTPYCVDISKSPYYCDCQQAKITNNNSYSYYDCSGILFEGGAEQNSEICVDKNRPYTNNINFQTTQRPCYGCTYGTTAEFIVTTYGSCCEIITPTPTITPTTTITPTATSTSTGTSTGTSTETPMTNYKYSATLCSTGGSLELITSAPLNINNYYKQNTGTFGECYYITAFIEMTNVSVNFYDNGNVNNCFDSYCVQL